MIERVRTDYRFFDRHISNRRHKLKVQTPTFDFCYPNCIAP